MARGARYSHGSRPTGAFPNASAAAAAAAAAAAPVPPPARGLPFPSHADQYRGYAGGSAHVMVTADGVPLPPGTGGAGFAGYQASGYMGPAGAYPSMVPEAGTDLYGAFPADSLLGPSSLLGFQASKHVLRCAVLCCAVLCCRHGTYRMPAQLALA